MGSQVWVSGIKVPTRVRRQEQNLGISWISKPGEQFESRINGSKRHTSLIFQREHVFVASPVPPGYSMGVGQGLPRRLLSREIITNCSKRSKTFNESLIKCCSDETVHH